MIRSALYLTALALVPGSLAAQNESALRRAFEGRLVAPRLDMPATKHGVNVYPYRPTPVDDGEIRRDITRHAVVAGKRTTCSHNPVRISASHPTMMKRILRQRRRRPWPAW